MSDVWAALGLGEEPPGLLYAVNKAYAEPGLALADGDEVAVIPPVSGGDFPLFEEPLDLAACVAEVESEEAGAIATFVGTTRIASRGRTVHHLEYEAYAGMAEQVMAEIADELHGRHDLIEIAIHHRIGRVAIGEQSVVIAVPPRTARTRSRPAPRRSMRSRSACRCGRKRSTRAARSGSEQGHNLAKATAAATTRRR